MNILGIDPGLKGGLALVMNNGRDVAAYVMPVVGNQINCSFLMNLLDDIDRDLKIDHAYLEVSHMRPGQSSQAVFTFARQIGALEMGLTACHIPFSVVAPQVWTKLIHKGLPVKMEAKEKSRLALSQFFPHIEFEQRAGRPHEGIMDAALIGLYGVKTHMPLDEHIDARRAA